ncbi:MAG: pyruvate formate lyase family protein, partial [Clostridia bacterium]|nr:pyruvate formate lyase family protein [Clostridia bacterium]
MYRFNKEAFFAESETFYSRYPADVSDIERELERRLRERPDASAFVQKKWQYETISRECEVKLFKHSPFYSEVITGRDRCSVSSGFPPIRGLASWVLRKHYPVESFDSWREPYVKEDLILADMMVDHSHHYANVENVLRYGFEGLKLRAIEKLPANEEETEYFDAIVAACDAAILLAERFSDEARNMLLDECDPDVRYSLEKIRDTARRIPRNPPGTFYEAMCAVWFTRELCTSFEGSGFAVLGHYDRILWPYYEEDLRNGRITFDEAQELMDALLSITDSRWDMAIDSNTNCSLVVGGCDERGTIVFNDVTRMILASYLRMDLINPKLQARVSEAHPDDYKMELARIVAAGKNVVS